MLSSSASFALRGVSRLSNTARQTLACTSLEVTRNFHVRTEDCNTFPVSSLDCQVRHRSNRSRRGLYDGKDVRAGNNVSFSMKSTKRTFKPNVFKKRVYSEILDEMILFHITTSALRSIDKAGGLDNYLLASRHVTEGEGYEVKKRILKVMKAKKKMEAKLEAEAAAVVEEVAAVEEVEEEKVAAVEEEVEEEKEQAEEESKEDEESKKSRKDD